MQFRNGVIFEKEILFHGNKDEDSSAVVEDHLDRTVETSKIDDTLEGAALYDDSFKGLKNDISK